MQLYYPYYYVNFYPPQFLNYDTSQFIAYSKTPIRYEDDNEERKLTLVFTTSNPESQYSFTEGVNVVEEYNIDQLKNLGISSIQTCPPKR